MFLRIDQVDVCYPGQTRPAVRGASLILQAGEIGVLIGPSGCGKTTLLRAVAGLERVCAGSIALGDETVSDAHRHMPPEQRRIGMVFQDYALFPHLDVGRNVGFGLRGLPAPERAKRVAEVLALVDLPGSERRFPHELSGGQQQRVALAHELRAILKAAGQTVLFVTHDQFEAFAIGDRIGVMNEGHLHQWDDAYTLYHRPETRFVADFIGHGVFVPAHIVQAASGTHVDTPLGRLRDTDECPLPSAYPGGYCDLLLRADDIVHDDGSGVKAQILRKAFRGSEFLYTLRLASGETVLAHVPSHHNHRVGEWIGIQPDVDHVVVFQPDPQRVPPA